MGQKFSHTKTRGKCRDRLGVFSALPVGRSPSGHSYTHQPQMDEQRKSSLIPLKDSIKGFDEIGIELGIPLK
jgi:hypothetical protein